MALLEFLIKNRRSILGGTLIAGIVGAIFSLVTPARYRATTCIMPSMDMIGAGSLQSAGTAMSMLQFLGGLAVTPADIYAEFATNRAVISNLIKKFRLDTVYKTKYWDVLIKNVSKHIETRATTSGLVYISYKDKSPERAAMLANALVDELDRMNREIIITKGKKLRSFLGKRLKEIEDSMNLYQDSLAFYQKKYGILDLQASIQSIIRNWQDIETTYFKTKLQYEFAKKEQGPNSKITLNLRNKLDVLTKEKLKLWNTAFDTIVNLPALSKLPEIGTKYVRIQLMLEKYTEIYKFLTTEYEKAKIMEKQDTPTLQVIYRASIPERRYWPQRKMIVLLFMAVFFFTYTTLLVLQHAISQNPQGARALNLIKRAVLNPFGKN